MLKKLLKDESGASAVEYGLLVSLIAVTIAGCVALLGRNVNSKFTRAGNSVGR